MDQSTTPVQPVTDSKKMTPRNFLIFYYIFAIFALVAVFLFEGGVETGFVSNFQLSVTSIALLIIVFPIILFLLNMLKSVQLYVPLIISFAVLGWLL